jgi:hypothetical protein
MKVYFLDSTPSLAANAKPKLAVLEIKKKDLGIFGRL